MVTELVDLRLHKLLESTLIHAEMVLLREPAICNFVREVVCLERALFTGDVTGEEQREEQRETYPRRSDPRSLFRRLCILKIESIVLRSHFLRGPWFRPNDGVSRPSGHIPPVS